jgi:hypothetical protein
MTEKKEKPRRWLRFVGVLVVLGVVVGITRPEKAPEAPKGPKTEADLAFEKMATKTLMTVKQLKASARNPASFSLVSADVMDDSSACVYFRAQNAFGGIDKVFAVLTPKEKIVTSEDDGFWSVWNKHCKDKIGRPVGAAINNVL